MFVIFTMAAVVVRSPTVVVRSVIWRTPVIAVVAARIVSVSVPWIAGITVAITGVTESDSDAAGPDGDLSVSLFYRHKSQSDDYQWK